MVTPGEPSDNHTATFRRDAKRTLAYTVPLRPHDRLAVLGPHPSVVEAAAILGADCVWILASDDELEFAAGKFVRHTEGGLPLGVGTVDHVVVPLFDVSLKSTVAELLRVVRPGGSASVVTGSRRGTGAAFREVSPKVARQALKNAGFTDVNVYAIPSVQYPRYLLPLGSRPAVQWYLRSSFAPSSRKDAFLGRVARFLPAAQAVALLDHHPRVFVARRPLVPSS